MLQRVVTWSPKHVYQNREANQVNCDSNGRLVNSMRLFKLMRAMKSASMFALFDKHLITVR
jgi:hypothetical protein